MLWRRDGRGAGLDRRGENVAIGEVEMAQASFFHLPPVNESKREMGQGGSYVKTVLI